MRLISAHVNNFGRLSDQTFDLNRDFNEIKEQNSWGKTTLANFISAMFYGLPNPKSKRVSDNARTRYQPWQGGTYGGQLVFEIKGKKYRVERDFGLPNDGFRLTDVTSGKSIEKIGREKIDWQNLGDVLFGISRTSYERSAYVPQGEIAAAKLDDGINEKLKHLIHATDENNNHTLAAKILEKSIKKIETNNAGGRLFDIDAKLVDLDSKISFGQACHDKAKEDKAKHKACNDEHKKHVDELKKLETQIKSQAELETLMAHQRHYLEIKSSIDEFKTRLDKLVNFFGATKKIEALDLENIKDQIDAVERQKLAVQKLTNETFQEKVRLENIDQTKELKHEKKMFLTAQMVAKEADKKKALTERARLVKEIDECKARQQRGRGFSFYALCIVTFGVWVLVEKNTLRQLTPRVINLQRELAACEQQLNDLDTDLISINGQLDDIKNFNFSTDPKPLQDMTANQVREELNLQKMEEALEKVLSQFKCREKTLYARFHEIKDNHRDYITTKKSLSTTETKLGEFLRDRDEKKLQQKLTSTTSVAELLEKKQAIDDRKYELLQEIAQLGVNIELNEKNAAGLRDLTAEKKALEKQREKLVETLMIVKRTQQFLNDASDVLATKYLMPLKNKCGELATMFDKREVTMDFDTDSNILIRDNGHDRELDYFSLGNKELISLCTRFALVDSIFRGQGQRPCIILDDPLINLDDATLDEAKNFIKKLSTEYQIIYLTCHESRKIG
ncbi:MAG: hypothetical protein FWE38_00400 [Firmicutes bacterium]|nr:hypothetical protein [Bacillota bacterium]